MHKRILRAILLAVAITELALGIPLGYTAIALVENTARNGLQDSVQKIATTLDDQLAGGRGIDLDSVKLAVPSNGYLVVATPGSGQLNYGNPPGDNPIVERVSLVRQGTVTLAVPSGAMRTTQVEVAGFVLLLVLLSVGISTVVATVTARRLAEPLRYVAERATRLGAGDFRPDSRRHEVHELDTLSAALDASASALAQLVTRERELVGDVSHQLRSRLTALHLRLETLAAYPDHEVAVEANAALEQADRLTEVLDELLAAAKAARALSAEPIDLSVELPAIAEEWRQLLKADGRILRIKVPRGLVARATPARLREAIGVLLDNARQHGGGLVTMTARRGEGTAVIEVSDSGPGVPDELTGHIFERGVSGHGSTGVGLALARALVDADGGRLELATVKPATFALFLPIPKADDAMTAFVSRADRGPR